MYFFKGSIFFLRKVPNFFCLGRGVGGGGWTNERPGTDHEFLPFLSHKGSVLCELQPGQPGNLASYTAAVITRVKVGGGRLYIYTSFITLSTTVSSPHSYRWGISYQQGLPCLVFTSLQSWGFYSIFFKHTRAENQTSTILKETTVHV